uniref:Uncharacterized protein n=1 Tax=Eutreptiella gymnastica TaxID=73025 RepID=A0A7S4CYB2_9EUGL
MHTQFPGCAPPCPPPRPCPGAFLGGRRASRTVLQDPRVIPTEGLSGAVRLGFELMEHDGNVTECNGNSIYNRNVTKRTETDGNATDCNRLKRPTNLLRLLEELSA